VSIPVVGVHGIGCYRYYEEAGALPGAAALMAEGWTDALAKGAGIARTAAAGRLDVAYYAHLLHKATAQGPESDLRWLDDGEQALLMDLVRDLGAPPQVAQGPGTVPVRQAAQWLASRFGPVAVGSVAFFCREVQAYLGSPQSPGRKAVTEAVANAIAEAQPRAVVAHSLGSVVAYETLWQRPDLELELLLTIGSPLGMTHVVRDRLIPPADPATGRGARPPGVATWINIADQGDIVAATGSLAVRFDGVDQQPDITIGPIAFHTATAYLSHPQVAAHLAPYIR
jgi:hypothetical protein